MNDNTKLAFVVLGKHYINPTEIRMISITTHGISETKCIYVALKNGNAIYESYENEDELKRDFDYLKSFIDTAYAKSISGEEEIKELLQDLKFCLSTRLDQLARIIKNFLDYEVGRGDKLIRVMNSLLKLGKRLEQQTKLKSKPKTKSPNLKKPKKLKKSSRKS